MSRSRLPPEAFEYYVGLGIDRSYTTVANRYGVSTRAVARRAGKDRWQQRLAALISGAKAGATDAIQRDLEEAESSVVSRTKALQDAIFEVLTPQRVKALLAANLKFAIQTGDVAATRMLLERALGKPRTEPLPVSMLDLPDGLSTTQEVRHAANKILQSAAAGEISPEDAQRLAPLVEAARKAIETDDIATRVAAIEDEIRKDKQR